MNEDLVEKIAVFIERQCPRRIFLGTKCSEYSCTVHWMAAQVRGRKFENVVHTYRDEKGQLTVDTVDVMR